MAAKDERYLFIHAPVEFMTRHPITGKKVAMKELVPVDEDAEPVEGEEPETEEIPLARSFLFFAMKYLASHPIFDMARGYPFYRALMRIMDTLEEADEKIEESGEGVWMAFARNDTSLIKQVFSEPTGKKDDKKAPAKLSAADARVEMDAFYATQFRPFIESCMNPLTEDMMKAFLAKSGNEEPGNDERDVSSPPPTTDWDEEPEMVSEAN